MPLNMKNIFKQLYPVKKNGSVHVTLTCAITHQRHLEQSGRRSAVDMFNTLCVFTEEPIREQEVKLELYESSTKHIDFGKFVSTDSSTEHVVSYLESTACRQDPTLS